MVNLAVSFIAAFAGLLFHLKQLQILDAPADERSMEHLSEEPPRRVTPTEARAKLLRSLIVQPVPTTNEADQKKLAELQLRFLRELASQP